MSNVQSIERAFSVLRSLAGGAAGVTELAEIVGLPKSTVSRLLSTLEQLGAVEQVTSGGRYRIGAGFLEIADAVQPGRDLGAAAKPHLVALMNETGEATGLSVMDGGSVRYIDQVESVNPVQVRDWTGEMVPLHVVSSGLVLLAHSPTEFVDDYLSRPLERFTAHSIVEHRAVRKRLSAIRHQGFCWVYEEFLVGINSVAAPIVSRAGEVIGAVHAHGPAYRFPSESHASSIAQRVIGAAKKIVDNTTVTTVKSERAS